MNAKLRVIAAALSTLFVVGVGLHLEISSRIRAADIPKNLSAPNNSSPREKSTPDAKPWGNLTYTRFNLTLPDEFFPQLPPVSGSLKWFFNQQNPEALSDLLIKWGLTDSQKTTLLDTNRWTATNAGCYISIPPQLVLELSPTSRLQVCSLLAASENNVGYRYPFRFPLDGFDKWFQASELAREKIKIVKSLTYTNNGTVCFSDLDALRHIFSIEEMRQLLQTLYETPTFILKLEIAPDSNLDALVRYWGVNNRARTIKPLLQSLSKTSEKSEISISYLLPPLPRVLLYSFPNPLQDNVKIRQDCLWTSLNFFSEQPDNRFLDSQYAQQVLQRDYETVQGDPQYGDLVALYDTNGAMMHVCVYIADDVVFTKNGVGQLQPWVFMKISDLKLKYASLGSVRLAFLRHKVPPNPRKGA